MKEYFLTETRARLRTLLAMGYALFIVYASLSPFTGWREQGLDFHEVLLQPWLLTYAAFDAILNFVSYLPLGLLLGLALRARLGGLLSLIFAVALSLSLSLGMEYLQMYLPSRTSSNMDLLTNGAGGLLGAILAVTITSWSWLFSLLVGWRSRLFHHGKEMDFGLALLALWMFGQINPTLPMLGNVFISEIAQQPFISKLPEPFDGWESLAVTLNLLMLGTLLLTLLRIPRNIITALMVVLSVVALAKFMTAALLLKSWALLLWINSEAVLGMLAGMTLLIGVLWLPRAVLIRFAATIAFSYFCIVNIVFDRNTPSAAMSIYQWHYGHLLNYNGLAQTITLAFPLLLIYHLWRIRKVSLPATL